MSRGLVITTKLGKPVDPRNFYRVFQTRCRRACLPTTTVHATRKACASLLVALDVHPRVAMQILRHSQIAVTMDVYGQATSDSTFASVEGARRAARTPLSITTRRHRCCTLLLYLALWRFLRIAKCR